MSNTSAGQALTEGMLRRVLAAGAIGTALEWYDFYAYATASALVFNKLFFPELSPLAGTLASFATLGLGFFARPVGGLFFGHLGDRIGRKPVLVMTLIIVGVGTTLIGLLPTYSQIGILAPILLLVLRLLQGFATGAEYSGAIIMAAEYAPPGRRGLITSIPALGVAGGNVLSAGVFAIITFVWKDELVEWAWRIPFLLSAVLVVVGLYIRMRVRETPAFSVAATKQKLVRFPIVRAVSSYKKSFLIVIFAQIGQNGLAYMFNVFGLNYITATLGMPKSVGLMALLIATVVQLFTIVSVGLLSDKYGRRPVYIGAALITGLMAFPFFWMVGTKEVAFICAAFVMASGIGYAGMLGAQPAFFVELFGTSARFSGFAFAREVGTLIGGAPVPLISVALVAWMDGQPWGVAIYIIILASITMIAVALSPETFRKDIAAEPLEPAPSGPDLSADLALSPTAGLNRVPPNP
ncbi:MFS transporter [Roseixanthobacter pseudopolyaromaticivorans]|uniref:MFS transporter n=1 Tax=Xanthobacteraceae TaxID=335928 RepID=UPI00372B3E8C